jgi:2-iminobutanoate/2-iminopropanoate deaminase
MRKLTVLVLGLVLGLSSFAASKKVIKPQGTPAGGNFSPGILVNGTLYVSGTTGTVAGKIPDSFEAEVKQALDNIEKVLKEAGYGFADVVAVQVYLTDMDQFQRMNEVYRGVFQEPRPARTTVGVTKLAGGAHIEITVTAHK